jgi:hypothetical protein
MTSDQPALVLPFRLRGFAGVVEVFYDTNRDAAHWGFELLNLPFASALTEGFPVCRAEVGYAGPGYRATMGWIQIVTVRDAATGRESSSLDLLPIMEEAASPFATFGHAPTLFDAPGPNPPRQNEMWTAESYLAICPDVARTRKVAALLGFRWGYELRAMRATPFAVAPCAGRDWDRHLPLLRGDYPAWAFAPGFAES